MQATLTIATDLGEVHVALAKGDTWKELLANVHELICIHSENGLYHVEQVKLNYKRGM